MRHLLLILITWNLTFPQDFAQTLGADRLSGLASAQRNGKKPTAAQAGNKNAGGKAAATKAGGNPPPADRASLFAAPRKTTFLTVNSNVPKADVAIDGILAGTTGSRLEVDAGNVTVKVSAQGYNPVQMKTVIRAGQDNRIQMNLAKDAPKPKPEARAQQQKAAVAQSAQATRNGSVLASKKAKKGPAKSRLFADEEEEDLPEGPAPSVFMAPNTSIGQPAPSVQQVQPLPQQPIQQFAQPPPQYAPPPQLPQQPYYQTMPQMPQPMYPAPGYGYMQPQQPYGYQPQPYGYQQPYPYPQQMPPTYAPPAAVPPMDSLGSAPLPPAGDGLLPSPLESPGSSDIYSESETDVDDFEPPAVKTRREPRRITRKRSPPPFIDPGQSAFEREEKRSSGGGSSGSSGTKILAALAPFGVGQFYNGNALLGTAFLVGQAGGIGGGIFYYLQGQAKVDEVRKFDATYKADPSSYTEAEYTAYRAGAKTKVAEYDQYTLISFGVFGGLWAISTIEALLDSPDSVAKKKAVKGRRRLSVIQMPVEQELGLGLGLVHLASAADPDSNAELSLLLAPAKSAHHESVTTSPITGLGLNWEF